MANKNGFSSVYDNMNNCYEKIDRAIYELNKNGNNELVECLESAMVSLLTAQKNFVQSYGDKSFKDVLNSNIERKENARHH